MDVIFSARRSRSSCCCRRRRRLLFSPHMSGGLGYQRSHGSFARWLHARQRPGATTRRRGDPRQPRGGAPALWLAEGAGTGAPRRSSCRPPRTAPTPRRINKLSVAAVTQVRPGAAADHQPAVTPRTGVYAAWIRVATAANWRSIPGAAARSPPGEVVSQRRGVRRRDRGVTEPPPSDPEDLLHVELLPRGRARAATRHSRARHEEMAGESPSRSAVKAAHCTDRASLLATARPVTATGR